MGEMPPVLMLVIVGILLPHLLELINHEMPNIGATKSSFTSACSCNFPFAPVVSLANCFLIEGHRCVLEFVDSALSFVAVAFIAPAFCHAIVTHNAGGMRGLRDWVSTFLSPIILGAFLSL